MAPDLKAVRRRAIANKAHNSTLTGRILGEKRYDYVGSLPGFSLNQGIGVNLSSARGTTLSVRVILYSVAGPSHLFQNSLI
jgi:hypothetical protein